jgi:hypothetical protein
MVLRTRTVPLIAGTAAARVHAHPSLEHQEPEAGEQHRHCTGDHATPSLPESEKNPLARRVVRVLFIVVMALAERTGCHRAPPRRISP